MELAEIPPSSSECWILEPVLQMYKGFMFIFQGLTLHIATSIKLNAVAEKHDLREKFTPQSLSLFVQNKAKCRYDPL